jgi:xanthine dehydrogenase FAD-binding subunit
MAVSYVPASFEDAVRIRRETGAVPVAGGTDLMVRYRSPAGTLPGFPWPVMFISGLKEMKGMFLEGSEVVIKAGTELAVIEHSEIIHPVLREAVRQMAAPALRNLGTLAGNICNASPAGDAICVLYALGAEVELTSSSRMRRIPIEHFITGPGRTVLKDDELMTAVRIPLHSESASFYRKVGTRKANALSKLSCTGFVTVMENRIADMRLALGAVGPVVVRSAELESQCIDMDLRQFRNHKSDLMKQYAERVTPIDDQRSTAEYRKETTLNLIDEFFKLIEKELS